MDDNTSKQDEAANEPAPNVGQTFSPAPEPEQKEPDVADTTPQASQDDAIAASPQPVESLQPSVPSLSMNEPAAQPPVMTEPVPASMPAPTPQKSRLPMMVLVIVVGIAVLVGIAFGAYRYGNNHGYTNGKKAGSAALASAQLKVPTDATMTAQCAEGEGTQYVKPSNIPMGPIYNVWKGKVTGIEYMLGQSEIANSKTLDLALQNQKYDHIDVMYEPSGHAGFTEPHYHVVLSMIPYSEEQKITCGNSSSSSSMTSSMSHM